MPAGTAQQKRICEDRASESRPHEQRDVHQGCLSVSGPADQGRRSCPGVSQAILAKATTNDPFYADRGKNRQVIVLNHFGRGGTLSTRTGPCARRPRRLWETCLRSTA